MRTKSLTIKSEKKMHNKIGTYILDACSGLTFIGGVITSEGILMLLGGIASLVAIINHTQQIIQRKRNKS